MTTRKKTLGKRKEPLSAKQRHDKQQLNRSEVLADPRAQELKNRLYEMALGRIEGASPSMESNAMNRLCSIIFADDEQVKTKQEAITITIGGIGAEGGNTEKDITPEAPVITLQAHGQDHEADK